jgi:hypothetical protein
MVTLILSRHLSPTESDGPLKQGVRKSCSSERQAADPLCTVVAPIVTATASGGVGIRGDDFGAAAGRAIVEAAGDVEDIGKVVPDQDLSGRPVTCIERILVSGC